MGWLVLGLVVLFLGLEAAHAEEARRWENRRRADLEEATRAERQRAREARLYRF